MLSGHGAAAPSSCTFLPRFAMKSSSLACCSLAICLAIGVMCAICPNARAQDNANQSARMAARRALEAAKIELRLYLQVDYPRQRRRLDAQIALAEEELKIYNERRREYEPAMRWSTGQPYSITMQDLRLCRMDAEFKLRDLYEERNALTRFHSDQWRLLELRVEDARAQVAAIEGNGGVAMANSTERQ